MGKYLAWGIVGALECAAEMISAGASIYGFHVGSRVSLGSVHLPVGAPCTDARKLLAERR